MKTCRSCGHRFLFYSGVPDVCLLCARVAYYPNGVPLGSYFANVPDKLIYDVLIAPEVLEAEKILRGIR